MTPRQQTLHRELSRVASAFELSARDVATATGAAPSTARAYLTGSVAPAAARRDRVAALIAVSEQAAAVMDRGYVALWLAKPVPALDGATPLEAIGGGDASEVVRLLRGIDAAVAA